MPGGAGGVRSLAHLLREGGASSDFPSTFSPPPNSWFFSGGTFGGLSGFSDLSCSAEATRGEKFGSTAT